MPRWTWPDDLIPRIHAFETRHRNPDAGALVSWAARCVESLHYLDDLDREFGLRPFAGHDPDLVDVTHARWATTTAITSLDLCAASLGRALCGHNRPRELALGSFDLANSRRASNLRTYLPSVASAWIDAVLKDSRYVDIKEVRDWLTHSRITRHFTLGPSERVRLRLGLRGRQVEVRQLIENSRAVATVHVAAFLDLLDAL